MTINYVFTGVAVADYTSALIWYTRFFGRAPDVIVTENESMWQVVGASWLYIIGDSTRAGKALFTILVDNLDDHIAELGERGFVPGAIETERGLYRKAVFTDSDGNTLSFGESLNPNT